MRGGLPLIGNTLGNYRITQKIGHGGVGEIWRAVDLSLDREVALKILRPEIAALDGVVARFRTEALALARLNHPNVATIHGFHTEGTPFIVMEYIAGQTLHVIVRGFGPMQSVRALPLFFQVLDAVEHAHDHGIVHRDLKASNVMLSQQGAVKMLDFGIARVLGNTQLTQGPATFGTPEWMAPEQIRGEETDVRTDVYALGLLLYWLTTARLPFESDNHYQLQRAHVEDAPPPPRNFAPNLPEAIEAAILRAIAKQRTERFPDVAEFRMALTQGFVPALTVPLIPTDTIDGVVPRTLPFATQRGLAEQREPLHPVGATRDPVVTVVPTTAELIPRRRWLPFAVTAVALSLAIAVGIRTFRQPAATVLDARAGSIAAASAAPAPASTLPPAPARAEQALAPPPAPTRAPDVPRAKRKPAAREPSQGESGWVINRR